MGRIKRFFRRTDSEVVVLPGLEVRSDDFPEFVETDKDRHRWQMAVKAARIVADDLQGDEMTVWLAARSLYNSDIPTGSEDESG